MEVEATVTSKLFLKYSTDSGLRTKGMTRIATRTGSSNRTIGVLNIGMEMAAGIEVDSKKNRSE